MRDLITLRRRVLDILSLRIISIWRVDRRGQRNDGLVHNRLGKNDTIILWFHLGLGEVVTLFKDSVACRC